MKVHAQPKPLTEPLPGGKEGATVTVEPLLGGELDSPPALFERPGGRLETLKVLGIGTPRSKWWTVPCPAFLIRHPGAGPMLVDTGLHPSVAAKPQREHGTRCGPGSAGRGSSRAETYPPSFASGGSRPGTFPWS